jgi:putative ATPase
VWTPEQFGRPLHVSSSHRHPVTNDYVPEEIKDMVFLKPEGDISDKLWDEAALRRWELKKNHGTPWEGKTGDHSMNDT